MLLSTHLLHAAQDRDARAIAAAQNAIVTTLISDLPKVTLKEWLIRLVGSEHSIDWSTNDCGEQTGNPAIDAGRDFPLCSEARIALPEGRALSISLMVGTFQKGVTGAAALRDVVLEDTARKPHSLSIAVVEPITRALLRRDGVFDLGRTRREVEAVLHNPGGAGGLVAIGHEMYVLGAAICVDVPYDDTGGPQSQRSRTNRINGPVRVFDCKPAID